MIKKNTIISLLLGLIVAFSGCASVQKSKKITDVAKVEYQTVNTYTGNEEHTPETEIDEISEMTDISIDSLNIPEYNGKAFIVVNNNKPYFTKKDLTSKSFERYSQLDRLGRCGVAYANIGTDIMPNEERGSIGMVKPSGWHTIRYENVDGKYLYNRCHLIGYQLSAENANISNLITGTRYLNTEGMLPFENMVADYVKETNNHVLYRVTPIFENDNLLASGVLMEGYSVEDDGARICYNVYCYNVQPGIMINYATGESEAEDGSLPYGSSVTITNAEQMNDAQTIKYIGNKNTKKFHYPDCSSVIQMKESNKEYFRTLREYVVQQGYKACARCCP